MSLVSKNGTYKSEKWKEIERTNYFREKGVKLAPFIELFGIWFCSKRRYNVWLNGWNIFFLVEMSNGCTITPHDEFDINLHLTNLMLFGILIKTDFTFSSNCRNTIWTPRKCGQLYIGCTYSLVYDLLSILLLYFVICFISFGDVWFRKNKQKGRN